MKSVKTSLYAVMAMLLWSFSTTTDAQCHRTSADCAKEHTCCCQHSKQKKAPIPMILGADFGSSTDDLFTLMMLNHYIDEGLVDLKGVVVNRRGDKNMAVVDIFNTYYGHPDIPIGIESDAPKNPKAFIPYNEMCTLMDKDGKPLFARTQTDPKACMEAYKLYRKILSEAENNSIVLIEIGFSSTLGKLIKSGADEYSSLSGQDLICQKVKAVYMQGGRFEPTDNKCGYNLRQDSKASKAFFDMLPKNVDIYLSPSIVGDQMNYSSEEVIEDLANVEINPIKVAYEKYKCDTGQRMWDSNCLIHAVLGNDAYKLSPRGWVTFVEDGDKSLMLFKEDKNGNARYQVVEDTYKSMEKVMYIRKYNRKVK